MQALTLFWAPTNTVLYVRLLASRTISSASDSASGCCPSLAMRERPEMQTEREECFFAALFLFFYFLVWGEGGGFLRASSFCLMIAGAASK